MGEIRSNRRMREVSNRRKREVGRAPVVISPCAENVLDALGVDSGLSTTPSQHQSTQPRWLGSLARCHQHQKRYTASILGTSTRQYHTRRTDTQP